MTSSLIRILLFEDNPGDADLIRESLAENDWAQFDVTCADRLGRGLELLKSTAFDVLLVDLGRHSLDAREVPLRGVVEAVVDELGGDVADREVEWRIGDLPTARCDPGLVKIAFTNLLENALKYTRGRRPAVIEVGSEIREGRSVVHVRDNGVGFDMQYADALFGVFQRLHSGREFEGTGVGLATVHRIVHRHRGAIWAHAEPDRGATFYFTLEAVNGVAIRADR